MHQLLMSGERDDGGWGLIGAFWLSVDGRRGGFIVSPGFLGMVARWSAAFEARSTAAGPRSGYFSCWEGQVGTVGTYMIDPETPAENLVEVARRVGAL